MLCIAGPRQAAGGAHALLRVKKRRWVRRGCSPFHGRSSAASSGGKLQLASAPAPSCSTDALSCRVQRVDLRPVRLRNLACHHHKCAAAYCLSAVSDRALCCSRHQCKRVRVLLARQSVGRKQERSGPGARSSVTRHAERAALRAGPDTHRRRERVLAQVGKQVRGGAAAGGRVERDARAAASGVPGQLQRVAGAREHGHVHVRQQRGVRRVAGPPRPHGHAHERVHLAQRARAGLGHAARRAPARRQALAGPSAPHSAWSAGGAGGGPGARQGRWLHSAHLCAGSASAGTRKLHGAPELQGVSSTSVREPTPASTTFLATCQASSPSMPGAPRSKGQSQAGTALAYLSCKAADAPQCKDPCGVQPARRTSNVR